MANPEKVFPFCELTILGTCAAENTEMFAQISDGWADEEFEEAFDQLTPEEIKKLLEEGRRDKEGAQKTRAGIEYCKVCPLRINSAT